MLVNPYAAGTASSIDLIRGQNQLRKIFEKLSSGLKINTASDDPAGLVISTQLRSEIAGIAKLIEGLEFQFNKYSTADGYLSSMQSNLLEMRDVTLAAANEGATNDKMRAAYQTILDRNIEGYNRSIENASFGSQSLLDGSAGSVANIVPLGNLDITSADSAQQALTAIDLRIQETLNVRADIGATQKYEFQSQSANLSNQLANLVESESSIRDADMALEFVKMIQAKIRQQAALFVTAHRLTTDEAVLGLLSR